MPYLPTRSLLGSDLLARNPRLRVAPCPFTGVPLVLVPALAPDVAILHVQRADADGNCHAWGPTGVSAAAGKASRTVIVVAEELVEPAVIRSDPNRTLVPGFLVTAVVHLPGGAHPSPVQGHYNRDHAVYARLARALGDRGGRGGLARRVGARPGRPRRLPREARPGASRSAPASRGPARGARSTTGADDEGRRVTPDYTPAELMVAAAAREIRDGEVVFVGMRLPLLAFCLARSTHAPAAVGLFENGVVRDSPALAFLVTMSDGPNVTGAVWCTEMREVMGLMQAGRVTLGFIGGAQVDRFGNLNTTYVGPRERALRLPGSGGAPDIASLARRHVVIMAHERRRFVERVDYVTSPGHGEGGDWRARTGLPGGGPSAVITTLGLFRFDAGDAGDGARERAPRGDRGGGPGRDGLAAPVSPTRWSRRRRRAPTSWR